MTVEIAVEWATGPRRGTVEVRYGRLFDGRVVKGGGAFDGAAFDCPGDGPCRLVLAIDGEQLGPGANATTVTVRSSEEPFTFFLRDVDAAHPIFVPTYRVAVTAASDERSYAEIERAIRARGLVTELARIDLEPEETFTVAAAATRSLRCPIWLGVGRDMRLFEMDLRGGDGLEMERRLTDWILPRDAGQPVALPEAGNAPCPYGFLLGRGWSSAYDVTRRLDGGVLPILHGTVVDDDVHYDLTAFATLEDGELATGGPRGTHFLVADGHSVGHRFTAEQEAAFRALLPEEIERPDQTVLCVRVEAVNTARVPRYAFFKAPFPAKRGVAHSFEGETGFGVFGPDRVFAGSRLNGAPLPQEEVAVLVPPGEAAIFDFFLPHRPLSRDRANRLAEQDVLQRLDDCRRYWQAKLARGARLRLPEPRIQQMVEAGLLHLDLVAYGREPDGTLAPAIGIYSPIGSESAPIVQFLDAVGWHDVARRALSYFLEKQHPDGFIQNFDNYEIEVGCVLWVIGEHYRFTRDDRWVEGIAPKLLKSCEFLRRWRDRNRREELRGRGYGLIEGQVADPVDPERSFMLNGYAYLGLSRAAETLAAVRPEEARRLSQEAAELKADIRTAFFEAQAEGPVVPLGDGSWCPTAAPWAGHRGPKCLFADGGAWYTHGAVTPRDSLSGPLYLVLQEVIAPDEPCVETLLAYHSDLLHTGNVAFAQPYYSPHPFLHLRRDEPKRFLRAYYRGFAGVADRETHTFWEHYYLWGPHKTHEEAWFLMQTRAMLAQEEGATLKLLRGVPRAWLADGERIELDQLASHFGPLSLRVESAVEKGRVHAEITCEGERRPRVVDIRLPHPLGRKAVRVEGADYHPESETARIGNFAGRARIVAHFA